jgi:hypothetical protein
MAGTKGMGISRTYPGSDPDGEEWSMLAVMELDGSAWRLWSRPQHRDPDWSTYKLTAVGAVPQKANYWWVRNDTKGCYGYTRDLSTLRGTRPALHAMVEQEMEKITQRRIAK